MTDEEVEKIIKSNMMLTMDFVGIRQDFEKKLQRTWVGLTPEEIDEIIEDAIDSMDALLQTMDKLKEKNT